LRSQIPHFCTQILFTASQSFKIEYLKTTKTTFMYLYHGPDVMIILYKQHANTVR